MNLYPSNLGYSMRRYFVDAFHFRRVAAIPANSLVLDLGGQRTIKRGQFDIARYDLRVFYLNLSITKGADVQADAACLPVAAAAVDVVICAETLEHVYRPELVVREAFRVLRPEGLLLITVPFLFRIHADPYDYGRYTDYYWQTLLQDTGFSNIAIERQGLYYSVLTDLCKLRANNLKIPRPFGRPIRWSLFHLFIDPMQKWALRRESKASVQANPFLQSFTTGFGIAATKSLVNTYE